MKNGFLCDYASNLPQKARVSLVCHGLFLQFYKIMNHLQISDVINSLIYLQKLNISQDDVRGVCLALEYLITASCNSYQDMFLISDEGRTLTADLGIGETLSALANTGAMYTSGPYALRFYAPERAKNNELTYEASAWSFGCLLYEVFYPPVN
jgi:hypothetical protein